MKFALKTKISTPELAASRAFYEQVFGMTVAEAWDEPDDRRVILAFAAGREEAYVEIYASEEPHDFAGLSLQFKVEALGAFIAALPEGVTYEGGL